MIKLDFQTGDKKIKIYKSEENEQLCNGNCLIVYQNEESVQIALENLHESYIRQDCKV
jgi:RNA recognition motif-containing protein